MTLNISIRLIQAWRILLKGTTSSIKQREQIPPITLEEISEIKQFFPMEKFFIFGHARSGTTLLARLIRVHPMVHCNWQGHFFTRPPLLESLVRDIDIEAWLTRRSNRWNRGKDLSPVILRGVCDLILERESRLLGKSIVGDKSPNSLLNGESVRLLSMIYPDAKLIFIVRDGRDAVLSHRFQSFIDATQHLSEEDRRIREAFIREPEPFLQGERSLFTPNAIRRAAQGWVTNINETNKNGRDTYNDHYYSLKFEDLIKEPWNVVGNLWSFLGADLTIPNLQEQLDNELNQNPDADWQQIKASEIAQPLKKGKTGTWREMLTTYDRQVFLSIAKSTLIEWGYPID